MKVRRKRPESPNKNRNEAAVRVLEERSPPPPPIHERQTSMQDKAREEELCRAIYQQVVRGASFRQIADDLGIDRRTVARYFELAFEDVKEDRRVLMARETAKTLARLDAIQRVWMPRALGGTYRTRDPNTGEVVVNEVKPDVKAVREVLHAVREAIRCLGLGNTHKLEVSGRDGGPVAVAIGPQEMAAKTRAVFGDSAVPPPQNPSTRVDGFSNGVNGSGVNGSGVNGSGHA